MDLSFDAYQDLAILYGPRIWQNDADPEFGKMLLIRIRQNDPDPDLAE
jgi:hypothetical protein